MGVYFFKKKKKKKKKTFHFPIKQEIWKNAYL